MNYKSISYILGWIMKVEGVFLLLPLAVSLLYREKTWPVFSGLCTAVLYPWDSSFLQET